MTELQLSPWVYTLSYVMCLSAIVLVTSQLVRKRPLFEKVLGLDLLSAVVLCMSVIYAIETKQTLFLELALLIAIVAFIATVAFARYLGREE